MGGASAGSIHISGLGLEPNTHSLRWHSSEGSSTNKGGAAGSSNNAPSSCEYRFWGLVRLFCSHCGPHLPLSGLQS